MVAHSPAGGGLLQSVALCKKRRV